MKKVAVPYEKRSDLEKVASQWHKLSGLHSREEWSAAVVRAATAAELAANFAIRMEFKKKAKLTDKFVDGLLRWANGLAGKMDRLLLPLAEGTGTKAKMQALGKLAQAINSDRNAVVHQGQFRGKTAARKTIKTARKFIEGLVKLYEHKFRLEDDGV